jgi:hypothetical protein
MEIQSCLHKVLRRLFLKAEVVPEAEGGTINVAAFEGTVNTLAAGNGSPCPKIYSRNERTSGNGKEMSSAELHLRSSTS